MSTAWYIYGAGGFGLETMDNLCEMLEFQGDQTYELRFVDDNPPAPIVNGFPVVPYSSDLVGRVTVGIGEPATREKIFTKLKASRLKPASVISPRAFVSPFAEIGIGCIVAPFCSIQSCAKLAGNVAVNTSSIVGHDNQIGMGAVISSMVNLGGNATIGPQSYIGMGTSIKELVNIGTWVIVGMGSVVYGDIPDQMIAMGNPARPIRRNENRRVFS